MQLLAIGAVLHEVDLHHIHVTEVIEVVVLIPYIGNTTTHTSGEVTAGFTEQIHDLDNVLDQQLIRGAQRAIENQEEVNLDFAIKNTDRAAGVMLSGMIAKKYGEAGLPDKTVNVKFKGSAGQSFGAFLVKGVDFKLEGETNDYFAKGLSGGRISILPPIRSNFSAEDNIIAGNTGLYGATSGELYINGKVGERFGVRNSGAIAVIEGAGDHCCEYMTGGRVVVLGETGRNFAAGAGTSGAVCGRAGGRKWKNSDGRVFVDAALSHGLGHWPWRVGYSWRDLFLCKEETPWIKKLLCWR